MDPSPTNDFDDCGDAEEPASVLRGYVSDLTRQLQAKTAELELANRVIEKDCKKKEARRVSLPLRCSHG